MRWPYSGSRHSGLTVSTARPMPSWAAMKIARPARSAARARRRGGTIARVAFGERLKKGRVSGKSVKRMSLLAQPGPQAAFREQATEPCRPRRQQVMAVREFFLRKRLIKGEHGHGEFAGKALQIGIGCGPHLRRIEALECRSFGNQEERDGDTRAAAATHKVAEQPLSQAAHTQAPQLGAILLGHECQPPTATGGRVSLEWIRLPAEGIDVIPGIVPAGQQRLPFRLPMTEQVMAICVPRRDAVE